MTTKQQLEAKIEKLEADNLELMAANKKLMAALQIQGDLHKAMTKDIMPDKAFFVVASLVGDETIAFDNHGRAWQWWHGEWARAKKFDHPGG